MKLKFYKVTMVCLNLSEIPNQVQLVYFIHCRMQYAGQLILATFFLANLPVKMLHCKLESVVRCITTILQVAATCYSSCSACKLEIYPILATISLVGFGGLLAAFNICYYFFLFIYTAANVKDDNDFYVT